MSLAGDSILVTPGSGATVATHTVGGKEHQVMMQADVNGHIWGSKPIYAAMVADQVHVNTANTVHFDLFNADAALVVRVLSILQVPNVANAVTGIALNWLLERTTSVGTGGSAVTPWLADTADSALDADITCRSKPTGGAAQSTDLRNYWLNADESNTATIQIASQGGLELVPPIHWPINMGKGIVLRQNEGLRCVQVTASAQGSSGWLITFSVE